VRKVTLLQPLVILLNIPKVSFLYGDVEIAVFEVTLYSVFLNAFTNDVVPGPAQFAEYFFHILAKAPANIPLTGNTADHLAAVATGRTPANPVRLDDMHVVAALGQMQSGRNSCEARPDNADIRSLFSQQRRKICNVVY
jgi:hypothetical protein